MRERVPAALRRLVADRANRRCEYCGIHEDDVFLAFEPDHIVALKHRGATSEDNLAWTCFSCNRLKGSDVASIDPDTGKVVRLFHPRRDKWEDHFRHEQGRILPLTAIGRVTEYLLQFNAPDSVDYRRQLARAGRL